MAEPQDIRVIQPDELLPRARELAAEGYRRVQICATAGDPLEVTYSFDKDYRFLCLRLLIPRATPTLPSISPVYWCAFTYENEMHDLYGIEVRDLAVNFNGNFYKTAVKTPFLTSPTVNPPPPPAPPAGK